MVVAQLVEAAERQVQHRPVECPLLAPELSNRLSRWWVSRLTGSKPMTTEAPLMLWNIRNASSSALASVGSCSRRKSASLSAAICSSVSSR